MTIKEQFLSTLDELGRSMCKGLSTGESPLAAESNATALRSEKNSFEDVHLNYTRFGCDNCTFYDSKIAQVLLGKSLKDMYENWDCVEDGCNGACVVSAQVCLFIFSFVFLPSLLYTYSNTRKSAVLAKNEPKVSHFVACTIHLNDYFFYIDQQH